MLNFHYKRDSSPIDDADVEAVANAIAPIIAGGHGTEKDYALLLAKMIARIQALKVELAKAHPTVRGIACNS